MLKAQPNKQPIDHFFKLQCETSFSAPPFAQQKTNAPFIHWIYRFPKKQSCPKKHHIACQRRASLRPTLKNSAVSKYSSLSTQSPRCVFPALLNSRQPQNSASKHLADRQAKKRDREKEIERTKTEKIDRLRKTVDQRNEWIKFDYLRKVLETARNAIHSFPPFRGRE